VQPGADPPRPASQDTLQMILNSLLAEAQPVRNLLVSQAFSDKFHDLNLSLAQGPRFGGGGLRSTVLSGDGVCSDSAEFSFSQSARAGAQTLFCDFAGL
jgi:hypothetical protein